MNIYQDTSFFTNEPGNTLVDRFNTLLKDTELFDCLVGYFYVSGFYKLQKSLENTKKIRILVGMGIDSQTFQLIENSQQKLISTSEFKKQFNEDIIKEMDNCKDTLEVEKGARTFVEWLTSGKLEIKAYKERKTHSKLYIMSFPEDDKDTGRVITGSSNFTQPGLERNLEFNVELRRDSDYFFAKDKFEELWNQSEPLTEDFINTLNKRTWLREDITPYQLYLKFIYEFLYDKIWNDQKEMEIEYFPPNFKYLDYQKDAVLDAYEKIQKYGGVFLSDVVGLGKTYMGALLAQQLKGTTLVIAPPALTSEHNPGGWKRVLRDFEVKSIVESKGNLEKILKNYNSNEYTNVIIDEAHEFRNEDTQRYEYLAKICKNKKVVLISATPFNNSPSDLLSLIKLFRPSHNSELPNPKVRNLEAYFKKLSAKQQMVDKQKDPEKYIEVNRQISEDIRENVLQYLMVRRTRNSIIKYYAEDLKRNNMKFPDVQKPRAVFYHFDDYINEVFDETLELINNHLHYAKYRPLAEEYQVEPDPMYVNSQRMTSNFMKILLIKRLESGSYAFKKSIDNSIQIHRKAIKTFKEKGEFYTSRDYNMIYSMNEDEDVDRFEELIEKGKIKVYKASQFKPAFERDLESDLRLLEYIQERWQSIEDYPKRRELINLLKGELKNKKVIIFTEFIDTATDIVNLIKEEYTEKVKIFTGKSSRNDMQVVLDNFDDNLSEESRKDDYRILVTTDTLSHGVNLHRSNTIINFDIPWNPTKMMQRAGRVQRLDTKFDEIYLYNFFPTAPIEETIGIKAAAENKIAMFIELLGNDSQLLTDEPIKSHDLFNKLTSDIDDEVLEYVDEELFYLKLIRDIRDNDHELFNIIENIPKKARVCRKSENTALISLMRLNDFKKIFKTTLDETIEIDFFDAIRELKAKPDEKGIPFNEDYYLYLHKNLSAFEESLNEPENDKKITRNESSILNFIHATLQNRKLLTSYQLNYFVKIRELVTQGHITKNQAKNLNAKLKNEVKSISSPADILIIENIFRDYIRDEDLKTDTSNNNEDEDKIKEVILSEYCYGG